MADIVTLEMIVKTTGAEQSARQLDQVAASTKNVTVAQNQQAQALESMRLRMVANATTAQATAINYGRLREGLQGLTTYAVGSTVPGLTQLAGVLGTMTAGAGLTVGVMAAVAGIGLAFRALTEDLVKNKKAAEEALEAVRRLGETEFDPDGGAGQQPRPPLGRCAEAADRVSGGPGLWCAGIPRGKLKEWREEVVELTDGIAKLAGAMTLYNQESAAKAAEDARLARLKAEKEAIEELERAMKKYAATLGAIATIRLGEIGPFGRPAGGVVQEGITRGGATAAPIMGLGRRPQSAEQAAFDWQRASGVAVSALQQMTDSTQTFGQRVSGTARILASAAGPAGRSLLGIPRSHNVHP